jgi:hypothetical protein
LERNSRCPHAFAVCARVIVANPLQVKAIAHAHVKTNKIDAGVHLAKGLAQHCMYE